MTNSRRRFKQTTSLKDRLEIWAEDIRQQAARMAPSPERDALLKKARQAASAVYFDAWAGPAESKEPDKSLDAGPVE